MNENNTMDTTGLFTRFGSEIRNFQGFGHDQNDEGNWYWFFTADLSGKEEDGREYELKGRKVFLDQVFHDGGDAVGHKNVNALCAACMDYLAAHGVWYKGREWRAVA